ncbi:MAG: immunity 63 family protein [Coriobacteriales bacterium]|nr:immunity 63 family protein [Coriobacteriales bacterium]
MLSTANLKKHVEDLYSRVKQKTIEDGVYQNLSIFWGKGVPSGNDGRFCYSDGQKYYYGISERGECNIQKTTKNLEEISYLAISSSIKRMSGVFELNNRIEGQDFRRLWFGKTIEYWKTIGNEYSEMAENEQQVILSVAPFND